MKVMGDYDVNYVVQVNSSTEVYIAVNYVYSVVHHGKLSDVHYSQFV